MGDEVIVDEIIDEMSVLLAEMGFSQAATKIWATLYFKGDKTQDDLSKDLGFGISSVSQAIGTLEKFGIVYISSKEGRKKVYSAEKSFRNIKRKKMEAILMFHIDPMKNLLSSRIDMINNKELKDKVKELKNMYSSCGNIISLILKTPYGKENKR